MQKPTTTMNIQNTAWLRGGQISHRLTLGWRRRITFAVSWRLILIGATWVSSVGPTAQAQAPLWFTPKPAEVVSAADAVPIAQQANSPAANAYQSVTPPQVAPVQTSPSDILIEEVDAPDLSLAVVNRISDKEETFQASTQQVPQGQTPLLNTESMVGPLQSAERLFGRLDLTNGLHDDATLAQPGPRTDDNDYLWSRASYTWVSPVFHHNPLYFEQPNLERYGIGRARVVQPLLSSVHFFGSIPLIPYKTLTHHPRERVYTLGQGRPGDCAPLQRGVVLGTSTVGEVTRFWHHGSGY